MCLPLSIVSFRVKFTTKVFIVNDNNIHTHSLAPGTLSRGCRGHGNRQPQFTPKRTSEMNVGHIHISPGPGIQPGTFAGQSNISLIVTVQSRWQL